MGRTFVDPDAALDGQLGQQRSQPIRNKIIDE
jgi:hypothetical protein